MEESNLGCDWDIYSSSANRKYIEDPEHIEFRVIPILREVKDKMEQQKQDKLDEYKAQLEEKMKKKKCKKVNHGE